MGDGELDQKKCTQKIGILPGPTKKWRIKQIDELNDDELDEFYCTLFADDINLHMSGSCFNVLRTTVNLELSKVDLWLRANKLSLNCNKIKFMWLNCHVIINDHSISPKDDLKYLGFWLTMI